jgi:uncharacterized protein YdeI (YjbR/CyaY-like superfamily)
MAKIDDLPHIEITDRGQWRTWLAAHHEQPEGVWVVTFKKHCGDRHVPWPDVVQESLCFGWIDSRTRRVDDDRVKVLVSPRKPGSIWSAVNKRHVAELQENGLMTPAGQRLIDAAQQDGSWAFLDDIDALVEPDDLRAALDAEPAARANWDDSRPSDRKRALYHIKTAKRTETRARRIAQIVALAAEGRSPAPGP